MKISVVIPLYNKRDTIMRALESVFNQTIQPDEIVVVNDGSTDGSKKIVAELNHPLVKLICQPNSGVSAARNRGISEAKCDWIAFLDADDEWLPEFLETIDSLYEMFPHSCVLATTYFIQNHYGQRRNAIIKKLPYKGDKGFLSNYFEVAECSEPPINSSAVVTKKDSLNAIGGFPTGIKSGEDLLTWARLAAKYRIAYSNNPLSVFVQKAGHTYDDKPTRSPQNPDLVGIELALLARNKSKIPGIRQYVAHWHKMRASIFLRMGMRKEAFREIVKSVSFNPFNKRVYVYILVLFLPSFLINKVFKRFGKT
jgi:glycosyltransferase involved in cell wall biosynthesis